MKQTLLNTYEEATTKVCIPEKIEILEFQLKADCKKREAESEQCEVEVNEYKETRSFNSSA